ncbi:MAG TPA: hypothetical protein VMH28_24430 [Candidatus Acidoferrales bacterium]|nr:hypothetical protein [Candidatus Acidoferrales bacterium]
MPRLLQWGVLYLWLVRAIPCPAQDQNPPPPPPTVATSDAAPAQVEDKRIFGVVPNNRTTEASIPFAPITAKRKFTIAYKDSFDWPVYPTAAAFALLYQIENQNPSFGQGMAGYAKRFAAAYGDQMIGNMMTEGLVPALGHQDPRYFRLGDGTKWHRAGYALTRIFVARMDSGRNSFNFSEWGGNSLAVAISNAYYPDTRNVADNVSKLLIQCSADAFSNLLKEFWPDVKRHLQKKHENAAASK